MFGGDPANPRRLRIKICGITNAPDAEAAVQAGADALGLNCFRGSKRYLDLERAAEWVQAIPAHTGRVAVMVNPSLDEALAVARLPFISALQLHGSESPEFCAQLAKERIRFAKAIPVTTETSLPHVFSYATEWIVLDSASADSFGGTGQTFPWTVARRFILAHPQHRVILAGGLAPENVTRAVREVRPFGVDVTTGVESAPGQKDHARMRAFIEAARTAS